MKRVLSEYYGPDEKTAKVLVDDVGIVSVQCWQGTQLIQEKSVFSQPHDSAKDLAEDWVL